MVEPSGKHKRYKEFLYDVLFNSSPQFVLLCAVALGQVKVIDMKNSDRVGLIRKIKVNKDDVDINHSTIGSLATNYHIPSSVSDVPPLVVRPRKRHRSSTGSQHPEQISESAIGLPGVYDEELTSEDVSASQLQPATGLAGDVYELIPEDAQAVIKEIMGQMWLTDPYDANTHQPFVTIPISWKLRNQFILQRPKMM